MTKPPILDHIGIAVESIDSGLGIYQALGIELEGIEEIEEQGVRVAFLPVGDTRVELLEAIGEESPIARHIQRRGEGLHHLCIRVPDIRATMTQLVERGYRLLSEQPLRGAHGCLVCFVHPKSTGGVLIELSESVASSES
jgi:methylmalonyl-CoA/ethylmalonyl-CoA epimerase